VTRFSRNQIRRVSKTMKQAAKKALMTLMMIVGLVMIFIIIRTVVHMACNIHLLSHKIRNKRQEEIAQLETQL